MSIKFNGKEMKSGDLEKALEETAVRAVVEQLRNRISSIRDPNTGIFPTVVVRGTSLDDMHLLVQGDAKLLEHVRTRLSPEENQIVRMIEQPLNPRAFLSWATEDRSIAEMIAKYLMKNGVDTWWSDWEISSGDSLRRKIDQGLSGCTHFIVLLTGTSIAKPWVNEEIDAGFIQHIEGTTKFIPIRYQLDVAELPSLMRSRLAPSIGTDGSGLDTLISDIFGISRKPTIGAKPASLSYVSNEYSNAAMAIAKIFVDGSEYGDDYFPQFALEELAERAGLEIDDAEDAVHELRHFLSSERRDRIAPSKILFAEFDGNWRPWQPAKDALHLAADLVNDPDSPSSVGKLAERYGWPVRRMNPAIAYLMDRDAISTQKSFDGTRFVASRVNSSGNTRRFVRSRSESQQR